MHGTHDSDTTVNPEEQGQMERYRVSRLGKPHVVHGVQRPSYSIPED